MKVHSFELLPKETRILFDKTKRKNLLPNNVKIIQSLKVHRNTANSWLRGEYNPSIGQLEKLGVDTKSNWKNIISINLEGGRKKFLIPEFLSIDKLSWLLGILDGDGIVEENHRIGVINQDTKLVKDFIETCIEVFGISRNDFSVEVIWNSEHNIGKELFIDKIKTKRLYYGVYKSNKPIVKAMINSRILYTVMENFRNFME